MLPIFICLLSFVSAIHSMGYEYLPVEQHLRAITFDCRTRDTVAAWEHFRGMFRAYKLADLCIISDDVRRIRDDAATEWAIARCARPLFCIPTARCAQVRAAWHSRAKELGAIIAEADWYIQLLEESVST